MKKIILLLLTFVFLFSLTACNSAAGKESADTEPAKNQASVRTPDNTSEDSAPELEPADKPEVDESGRMLIAYFSATGNTEAIAQHLESILDADLYEIVPEEAYSSADLDYNTDCRANREQNDPTARPGIAGTVADLSLYDVVFLGYPIWWGQAPKIISTFLESDDFSGKTIVPFCTSGSSGIGSSATNLEALTDGAEWLEGHRFSGSASRAEVESWVNSLHLQ